MSQRGFPCSVVVGALALLSGCDDFVGAGLDPSRAGPYEGPLAGNASGGSNANSGSNTGASGSGSGCENPPCPGSGGDGQVGTPLVSDLGNNVSAIALDDEFVYFTTGQGLARVPKEGGEAEPLGGFSNVNALAVAAGYVYLVEDSGAVTRVFTGSGEPETIVPATMGGGSGSIVADATDLFYTVGPYLRRAPLEGGAASDLTSDIVQGGVTTHRFAMAGSFLYYVANPMGGVAYPPLRKIRKDAPGGMTAPDTSAGTLVTAAKGWIGFVASDGETIYFVEVGSDGLNAQVEIRKLTSVVDQPTELIATFTASGNNNNPGSGGDMVIDGVSIYVGGSAGIYKVSVGGGEVETIDAQAMTNALALDDRYLYWADQNRNGSLRRLAK